VSPDPFIEWWNERYGAEGLLNADPALWTVDQHRARAAWRAAIEAAAWTCMTKVGASAGPKECADAIRALAPEPQGEETAG